jgi:diaminopimelate epimerase
VRDVEYVKGHGTENDFVVLPDPDGGLELTERRVRALCDRRQGLGADGVLRVVRTSAVEDAPPAVDADTWFMDYRNADGSVAEMCGNGMRVFARYLVAAGLVDQRRLIVGTRSGPRRVEVYPDGDVCVDMGPATVGGRSTATTAGRAFEGVVVDVGNPHLACHVDGDLAELDLSVPPGYDPVVFPHGVNIEFLSALAPGVLRMRVHERGVGETRACGTGTVAAVAAAAYLAGRATAESVVEVPGGRVRVTVSAGASTLTGPAVLVAKGLLDQAWWEAVG